MNPPAQAAPKRAFPRAVVVALVGCLLASMLALASSVSVASAAPAHQTTDPNIANVLRCENGGATIGLWVDNRSSSVGRPINVKIGWKTVGASAIAGRRLEYKYRGIPDGIIEVSYTFGNEPIKATLTIDCKAELGMASVKPEIGCSGGSGYASFVLTNPTNHEVTYTMKGYGLNRLVTTEESKEVVSVPARQDRVVNFLNLSDADYMFEVETPDEPMDGFFSPIRAANYLANFDMKCSATSGYRSEPFHVITTTCSGTNGAVRVHSSSTGKYTSVALGSYRRSNYRPQDRSTETMISGIASGRYDIAVRVGTTNVTFRDRVVDCVSATLTGTAASRAEIKSSCLAENGRIDAYVYNDTLETKTYSFNFPNLSVRKRTVRPGGQDRMTITGRRDGTYSATVTDELGNRVTSATVNVACDPKLVPARVKVSCLAGNGRVDVVVGNLTPIVRSYDVAVGNIQRQTNVSSGDSGRVTVTGRPDGPLTVQVKQTGVTIHTETVQIACD